MRMIAAFEKTERVRHIGHLDLMRAVQRALRRSGLPIRYSQGFNPHVLLSFASPLPVGVSGAEELMETTLEEAVSAEDFLARLRPAMPESLPLLAARVVSDQHPKLMASLRTASYVATFPLCDASRSLAEAAPLLYAKTSIPAIRKTKSGEKPCDIRPMLHELTANQEGEIMTLSFRVSLTEIETLKPDLLLSTLAEQVGVSLPPVRICRIRLWGDTNGRPVCLMEL